MKKIATNYLTQIFGKGFSMLAGLLVVALLTRYLSVEDWAAYVTATTFLSFFAVFVDFGLTLTLTQMISTVGVDEKKIIGSIMGIRLASGIIFYTLSAIVVTFLPYSPETKTAVATGAAAFFFMSAAGSMIGLFQKHLVMRRYVIAELASRALYLLLTFLCVIFNLGLLPILGAMGVANGLWLLFIFVAARPLTVIRPQFDWTIWKNAFHRSAPIAISTIFNLIYLRGDVLILAWARPDDVAQYGTAYKVVDVLTAFPTMFMGLLLPQLTLAWSEKNKEAFKNILQKTFNIFSLVAVPLFLGAQIVAVPLTVLIAGQRYAVAGLVLQIPLAHLMDRIKGERDDFWMMFYGTLISAFVPLAYLIIHTPGQLYLIEFLLGAAAAMAFPSFMAIFTRHIGKEREGVEWGIYFTLVDLGSALAATVGGLLAVTIGFPVLIVGLTVVGIFGAFLLFPIRRHLRMPE